MRKILTNRDEDGVENKDEDEECETVAMPGVTVGDSRHHTETKVDNLIPGDAEPPSRKASQQ